ncbi:MAG: type II secretion system protein GspL [Pseudomonadota bacterium]
MSTLYIRHPAKVSVDASGQGAAPVCHYALASDNGKVEQQGSAALGSLGDLVAGARRVVLLLSAADVTLLRVKVPPMSAARLRAALPNMIEEQILGDPADCVVAAGPEGEDGLRAVAVMQKTWLAVLVKALLAQGARSVSAVPGQLCLPLEEDQAVAAIQADQVGLELTLRLARHDGMGMTMAAQPLAALLALRAFAGERPLTVYLAPEYSANYQELGLNVPGVTIENDRWEHWVDGAAGAGIDLAAALGGATGQGRSWQAWRWPLRLVFLLALVNLVGLNMQYMGLKRDAERYRHAILATFKNAYPNETVILDPAAQMRKNIAAAQLDSGKVAPDEFTAVSAAFGEALNAVQGKGAIVSLAYRDRTLTVKIKPDRIDGNALTQIKSALAARHLSLTESGSDSWQIRATTPGAKS